MTLAEKLRTSTDVQLATLLLALGAFPGYSVEAATIALHRPYETDKKQFVKDSVESLGW